MTVFIRTRRPTTQVFSGPVAATEDEVVAAAARVRAFAVAGATEDEVGVVAESSLAIPYGADEPQWESASNQEFEYDFSDYSSLSQIYTGSGGRWSGRETQYHELGAVGTGYNPATGASEGRAFIINWPTASNGADSGIEGPYNPQFSWAAGRVFGFSFNYRTNADFDPWDGDGIGKKLFLIDNPSGNARITGYAGGFSLQQVGGAPYTYGDAGGKIDPSSGGSTPGNDGDWDTYEGHGTGRTGRIAWERAVVYDGLWHRMFYELTIESATGAQDGRFRMFFDGRQMKDLNGIGTGTQAPSGIECAMTFNNQTDLGEIENFANIRGWQP